MRLMHNATLHPLNSIADDADVLIPIQVNLIVQVFYRNIKKMFSIYIDMPCSF